MKKIAIIGKNGTGKSVLSRKLGAKLKLPVFHLDTLFHQPNWTKPEPGKWVPLQEKLVRQESWIIDGTYHRTLSIRLDQADTIIFLALPKWLCFYIIIKRRIMYRKKQRPDLPAYLKDRLSLQLMKKLFFSQMLAFLIYSRNIKIKKLLY